jgi:hypothetical protein
VSGRRIALLAAALLAAACRKSPPLSPNLNAENKVAVRPALLYYEAPTMLLTAERRNVALPENPAGAMAVVVRELFKPSANPTLPPLFPPDATVRATFLVDTTAFVDLGGPTLTVGWGTGTHQELMAVYSVVQTVTANFPDVKRVRILINGEPAETLAGHIALARALAPMPALVSTGPPLPAPAAVPVPPTPAAARPAAPPPASPAR